MYIIVVINFKFAVKIVARLNSAVDLFGRIRTFLLGGRFEDIVDFSF